MRNEEQTAQVENSEKRSPAESTSYRILVMTLVSVAQDRADIAEAVKFLTRHMKGPRRGHVSELKMFGSILDEEQEMCVDVFTTKRLLCRCKCLWIPLGL